MQHPPETPCKRIRRLRNEQSSPEYILKPPPGLSWADKVFELCDTLRSDFNEFTQTRMSKSDQAAPEMLLNTLGNLRLTLTDLLEKPSAAKPSAVKSTSPVRIVVQLKHLPALPIRDLPARDIYQRLAASASTLPRAPTPLGVHWNRNNNLIISFPSDTSHTSVKTLYPSIRSLIGSENPPTIRFDVPWRKVHLAGIRVRDHPDQPIASEEELWQTLQLNPALQDLSITVQPTWLKKPESITGTHTSAVIAFEDLDGSVERALLKTTIFAFGKTVTIKKWHDRPPAKHRVG
ncbi:hypothetical protein RSOLAG22IIIB_09016 [Rhizoctonia solani]|uniref:Uncharacterized protein n=1 Tax=Rhizoctonia solani TaxID=456999 RepID=A0A0K6FWJ0_9AGAM|nr:hypothetical protein RSOLAG22IIIB_09016 [Rhizoctonia solani]